ncbi:MAG TPA: FliG C-terminal domain-containing protein [Anaeromyxobacteraceae bacterium]|nr:FliG C-terminal domain-containing protein [Anaeromyxobacteraceae bacterium]
MHETGLRGLAIAAAIVLLAAGSASAAETRIAEVVAAKIEMQRSLSDWLAGSLGKPAAPFRVDPVVQVTLRGEIRELRQEEETVGGDVKFGGKTSMKLPGLGYADAGGNNTPEVVLKGPGKKTTRTVRELDLSVVRMVVRLYVDPAMPKDRRQLIKTLAADLVGIEPARGDELVVDDLPAIAAVASAPVPLANGGYAAPMVAAPSAATSQGLSALALFGLSVTAILVAVILAWGLSRRQGGASNAVDVSLGRGGDEEGGVEIVDGRVIDGRQGAGAVAGGAAEASAFPSLAGATPRELAEVLCDVDPAVAAAIIESVGLGEEAAKLFYVVVPGPRQTEIGLWLGKQRVIPRTELAEMETAASAAIARVRSRVTVGGAGRLAAFLSAAPDDVRGRLLDEVAARDATLADAARGSMVVFDDLARFTDKSVRRVVTGIDPGVVALALVNANDGLRSTVLNAVSKRLRGIIEGEAEAVQERPARDVEAARRVLERSMLQLHTRGELVPRAA